MNQDNLVFKLTNLLFTQFLNLARRVESFRNLATCPYHIYYQAVKISGLLYFYQQVDEKPIQNVTSHVVFFI